MLAVVAGWIPPRLRQLLGSDLDEITGDRIDLLIGLPEESDLEFKALPYGTTAGAAKEAAYDLAMFANAGGGLLILGIEEDGHGVATAVREIPTGRDDIGLWVDQVNAARIFPSLSLGRTTNVFRLWVRRASRIQR